MARVALVGPFLKVTYILLEQIPRDEARPECAPDPGLWVPALGGCGPGSSDPRAQVVSLLRYLVTMFPVMQRSQRYLKVT